MLLPAMVLTGGVAILLIASPALIFGFGPIPRAGRGGGAGLALVLYYFVGSVVLAIPPARRPQRVAARLSSPAPAPRCSATSFASAVPRC